MAQVVPTANVIVDELRAEGFAKATIKLGSAFDVELGVSVETSRIGLGGDVALAKTLTYAKPRALFTWRIGSNDQLRVRLESEIGQLNFADLNRAVSAGGVGL